MEKTLRPPTACERKILDAFAQAAIPWHAALEAQLAAALVAENTGDYIFLSIPDHVAQLSLSAWSPLQGQFQDPDGMSVMVLLFFNEKRFVHCVDILRFDGQYALNRTPETSEIRVWLDASTPPNEWLNRGSDLTDS